MRNEKLERKIFNALEILRLYEPPEGYFVGFSGGKDSIVILDLVRKAKVKHDAHFHKTSIDPPELLKFIREYYPDVIWERPERTMFQLIEQWHMTPTRQRRYCCSVLKECHGYGRLCVLGIRKAESLKRSKRSMLETDAVKSHDKRILNIIIDWTNRDVWDYIKLHNLPYPSLYDEGWKRIGCIGCPMANRKQQFQRYPNFKKAYIEAIRRSMLVKPDRYFGTDPDLYFEWWMSGKSPQWFLESKKQTEIEFDN